jgi:AraC-like DNA-binding protein
MRALGTFADADGVSQVLLRTTVSSTVYCLSTMTAPWGFRVAARQAPAFHLLTAGSGWLNVEGDDEGRRLHPGDLVILPHGDAHSLRDSPGSPALWLDDILVGTPPLAGRLAHGGGGDRSDLICGGFAVDQLTARPLLEALPRIIHLRGRDDAAPEWLADLTRMITLEMAWNGPGTEAVVTRLSDALLAQALRAHLVSTPHIERSAVLDVQIARALRLMREHIAQRWSVPQLATAVGLSRSAFAQRFQQATGESPMRSLTRYRLTQAARYLRTTDAGLKEIARYTGYESEISMSKAFRRMYGTSPGAYRKAAQRIA